jgi:RNA polymerase sigma-70 factor (ECF subfamily)
MATERGFEATTRDGFAIGGGSEPLRPKSSGVLLEHRNALLVRAWWLTRDRDEAADLVQDTFERALRSGAEQQIPAAKIRRWLLVTLQNLFLDRRRASWFRTNARVTDDALCAIPDPEPETRAQETWRIVDLEAVQSCVGGLSGELRATFELFMEGRSYAEIGARLQLPPGTVATRLFRARHRLRRMLLSGPLGARIDP